MSFRQVPAFQFQEPFLDPLHRYQPIRKRHRSHRSIVQMIHPKPYLIHGDEFQSSHMSAFLDRASNLASHHLANIHEAQAARNDHRGHIRYQSISASVFHVPPALQTGDRQYLHVHQNESSRSCPYLDARQFQQHQQKQLNDPHRARPLLRQL